MKSTDSGWTWDSLILDLPPSAFPSSTRYFYSSIDAHPSGQVTALIFDGEVRQNLIANSTDFGTSWNIDTIDLSRTYDIEIVDNSLTIATGRSKWLVSRDQGKTWSKADGGGFDEFRKVDFLNSSKGLILGSNTLYLTTDSAKNWSSIPLPFSPQTAQYIDESTLIIKSMNNGVYMSRDTGNSWDPWGSRFSNFKQFPFSAFTSADTAYFAGYSKNGVQTFDGANYISRMVFDIPGGLSLTNMVLLDSQRGFLLSSFGQILQNTDIDGDVAPYASFTLSTEFEKSCPGEEVNITNISNPAYDFIWTIDEDTISTAYEPTFLVPDGFPKGNSDHFTITLEATYKGRKSIAYRGISLERKAEVIPFSDEVAFIGDSVCIGETYKVSLNQPNDYSFTTYQLIQDNELVSNGQGDGATLESNPITTESIFTLLVKDSSRCKVDSIQKTFTVSAFQFNTSEFYLSDSNLCFGNPLTIKINNPQSGVSYQAIHERFDKQGNAERVDFGSMTRGNDKLPTYTVSAHQNIRDSWIRVNRGKSLNNSSINVRSCRAPNNKQDSVFIKVYTGYADFQIDHTLLYKNEENQVRNFSLGDYKWNFDPLPDSLYYEGKDPVIKYEEKGRISIKLESEDTPICQDSSSRDYFVVERAPLGGNSTISIDTFSLGNNYMNFFLIDMESDSFGNKYVSGYATYSTKERAEGMETYFIAKIDTNGQKVWVRNDLNDGDGVTRVIKRSIATSLSLDSEGNVYVIINFNKDRNFNFYLGEDEVASVFNNRFNSFLLKLNNEGKYQWHVRTTSDELDGITDVICTKNDEVFFSCGVFKQNSSNLFSIFTPDGNILNRSKLTSPIIYPEAGLIGKLTPEGNIDKYFLLQSNYLGVEYFRDLSLGGVFLNRSFVKGLSLHEKSNGELLVAGNYTGRLAAGDNFLFPTNQGILPFAAVLDPQNKWESAISLFEPKEIIPNSLSKTYKHLTPSFNFFPSYIDSDDNSYFAFNFLPFGNSLSRKREITLSNGEIIQLNGKDKTSIVLKYNDNHQLISYHVNPGTFVRAISEGPAKKIYYSAIGFNQRMGIMANSKNGVAFDEPPTRSIHFLYSSNEEEELESVNLLTSLPYKIQNKHGIGLLSEFTRDENYLLKNHQKSLIYSGSITRPGIVDGYSLEVENGLYFGKSIQSEVPSLISQKVIQGTTRRKNGVLATPSKIQILSASYPDSVLAEKIVGRNGFFRFEIMDSLESESFVVKTKLPYQRLLDYGIFGTNLGYQFTTTNKLDSTFIPTYYSESPVQNFAQQISFTDSDTINLDIILLESLEDTTGTDFTGKIIQPLNGLRADTVGVENLLLFLVDDEGNTINWTNTDENGNFSFSEVPTGNYTIWLDDMGIRNQVSDFFSIPEQLNPIFELTDYLKLLNPLTTSLSRDLTSDIHIYPNPTTGSIHIQIPKDSEGKEMMVSILDLGGQQVQRLDVKQATQNTLLSLEGIAPGFYLMKILIGEKIRYEKFRKL